MKSLEILLSWFDPLVIKIAERIHYRMHGRVSIDELCESGRQELRQAILMSYTIGGRAKFNRYATSAIHSGLWNMYRLLSRDYPVRDDVLDVISDHIDINGSANSQIAQLVNYMIINLNQHERRIVKDCIMGGRSCAEESRILHVSQIRVSQIKNRAIIRLRKVAKAMELCSADI